jgi:hypothetical protein
MSARTRSLVRQQRAIQEIKPIAVRTSRELARVLNLGASDARQLERHARMLIDKSVRKEQRTKARVIR